METVGAWVVVQLICINQQMSDQQVAFDDWQAEAEAVVEEVKNEPPPTEPEQPSQTKVEEAPKEKEPVVDPKQVLLSRIATYSSLSADKFEDYLEEAKAASNNNEVKSSNQILKNDKDFAQFAKAVGKRINEQATADEVDEIEEGSLFVFAEELLLLLYAQTEWKNMEGVKDKLKIVKRERKQEEVKAKKRQEKEERERKLQKAEEQEKLAKKEKVEQKPQEDLFEGATFVNAKQVEEELKNKEKVKVEAPKPAQDEDDDFM